MMVTRLVIVTVFVAFVGACSTGDVDLTGTSDGSTRSYDDTTLSLESAPAVTGSGDIEPTESLATDPSRTGSTEPPATEPPATEPPVSVSAVTEPDLPPADLVLVGGTVLTMTEPARTASIAIAGDRIVAIEDAVVEAMIGPETTVVDVEGRTVMPGLVDAHSHFYNTAAQDGIGPQIAELILSSGITTTAELAVDPSLLATIQGWADDDLLRVRTSVYLLYDDACGSDLGDWWRDVAPTREPGEMFRIGGLKLFLDGGSCNVPAVTYTYSDGSSGDLYFDVEQLVGVLDEVEAAGRQIVMHALGDRAVRTALDAFDQAVPAGNPNRHRIDHNAVVAPELRGRYDGSGAVAALFGAYSTCFVTNGAGDFKFRTPPEFLEWEWPWRAVLDQNPQTHFAWHADYPVLDPSIGRTLEGFVTRSDGDCVAPPDVAVNAITAEEALELMTLGSAYALDRDTEVGSLDVGKFADLIVLDRDPLWSPLEDLAGTSVVAAYVGGNAEYCADDVANWCD